MNTVFILIMAISTSLSSQSGAAGITVEFNTYQGCIEAGTALAKDAHDHHHHVLTWGCFKK